MRVLFFLLVWASPSQASTVHFPTQDGWTLSASYHPPRKGRPVAVLVHGVAAGKGEWGAFSRELWNLGVGTLAVDLRGHGESVKGPAGPRDFADFDATGEWPRAENDLRAAVSFLKKRGFAPSRIGLAGASIGANLVSQAASGGRFAWIILLSPGADYRGVSFASDFGGNKVLLAASPADSYSYQTIQGRYGGAVLEAARGHGVQMFEDPAFLKKVLEWVKSSDRPLPR